MRKFIKTVIVVLLVTLLAFSVCACKKESGNTSSGSYFTDESSPISSDSFDENNKTTQNGSTTSGTPSGNATDSNVEQSTTNANGSKATSSTVGSIDKTASLTITKQPQNAIVAHGEPFSFSVEVSGGKAPYKYQWNYKTEYLSEWNDALYHESEFKGKALDFTVKYQCVITDANGNKVTSDTVCLIEKTSSLSITTQPKDATASAGSKVTFSVAVSGGKAPYTYAWQRNSQGKWENITDSSDAWSYGDNILSVMAYKNSWMVNESIRCVVKDAGGNTVTSNSVKVILAEPLAITAQPKDVTASAGSKVELSVAVSGGKAPYTYTWQSNSQGSWENITDSADAWSYGGDTLFVMAYKNTWMVNESIRCVVKDADGNSVTSNSVRVRIG